MARVTPTPEQVRELVEHFGGQRRAGEAAGVARTTIQYWLNPAPTMARMRRHYAANTERYLTEQRERYHNLSGYAYNRLRLRQRRVKALHRRAERERRRP